MWEQLDFPHRAKTTLTSNCGPLLFPLRRFSPSRCKVFRVLGGAAFPHLAKTAFLAERSFPLRSKRALLFAVQLLSFARKRHSARGCAWFRWGIGARGDAWAGGGSISALRLTSDLTLSRSSPRGRLARAASNVLLIRRNAVSHTFTEPQILPPPRTYDPK